MGDDGIVKILGIGEVRVVRIGQPGGWKLPAISNLIHASNTRYNLHGIGDVFQFKICWNSRIGIMESPKSMYIASDSLIPNFQTIVI